MIYSNVPSLRTRSTSRARNSSTFPRTRSPCARASRSCNTSSPPAPIPRRRPSRLDSLSACVRRLDIRSTSPYFARFHRSCSARFHRVLGRRRLDRRGIHLSRRLSRRLSRLSRRRARDPTCVSFNPRRARARARVDARAFRRGAPTRNDARRPSDRHFAPRA